MIDHLLRFDDEATAQIALPSYWMPATDDGPGDWRGDVCIPNVRAYTVTGTEEWSEPDNPEETYTREVRAYYPGWFVIVALPELSEALRDLPGGACRLITDRIAANQAQPFIRFTAPDVTPEALGATLIEPTFAGSNYPFGSPA